MQQSQFKNKILIHKDPMYRLALRILKNKVDAEDMVQDSLLKLWNKRQMLEDVRNLKSFSMTIVRNACIDFIRKQKPQSNQIDQLESNGATTPERQLEVSDQLQKIKELIQQLNPQQRELIQLRDIEGLDFEEISEITGYSVNNSRVILSRARKEIRKQMKAVIGFRQTTNVEL